LPQGYPWSCPLAADAKKSDVKASASNPLRIRLVNDSPRSRIGERFHECGLELSDLAAMFNPILRGWQQYYGRFHG